MVLQSAFLSKDMAVQFNQTIMQGVEAVTKSFKMTEEEMKRKASMMAKERSDKELAFSQTAYDKEN